MERTHSALTDLEAVKFLIEDWSHKVWRPATPEDQERFERLEQSDIKPLVALGAGAYGSVNLCRVPVQHAEVSRPSAPLSTISGLGSRSEQLHGGRCVGTGEGAAKDRASATEDGSRDVRGEHLRVSAPSHVNYWPPALPHKSASGLRDGLRDGVSSGSCGDGSMQRRPEAQRSSSSLSSSTVSGVDASGSDRPGVEPVPASSSAAASPFKACSSLADLPVEADAPAEGADARIPTSSYPSQVSTDSSSQMQPASSMAEPQLIVAVKRVPLGWNQERELMQLHRCQRCPFIVRLFGFVEDGSGEHCSYIMEWAEGGDLGAMLSSLKDRRGANKQRLLMSEKSARYYFACLLLALEFLHSNGLLHRDVKPSNLLLTSDGTAKLADLGFTVALDPTGRTVGCCGTTGYIAPEVWAYGAKGHGRVPYGVPADMWSAGATLHQILTGNVVTEKPEEVLEKGWRPPINQLFSGPLQDLMCRLLAAKPTARPQSAAAVMRHPWFEGFDWAALRAGRMPAPYVPRERRRAKVAAEAPESSPQLTSTSSAPTLAAAAHGDQRPAPPVGPTNPQAQSAQHTQQTYHHHQHQHHASHPQQRLATVLESTPSGVEFSPVPAIARGPLSGCGEGSARHGRDGLVRQGSSFDTALHTLTPEGARAAAEAISSGGAEGAAQGSADSSIAVAFAVPVGVAECA